MMSAHSNASQLSTFWRQASRHPCIHVNDSCSSKEGFACKPVRYPCLSTELNADGILFTASSFARSMRTPRSASADWTVRKQSLATLGRYPSIVWGLSCKLTGHERTQLQKYGSQQNVMRQGLMPQRTVFSLHVCVQEMVKDRHLCAGTQPETLDPHATQPKCCWQGQW